MRGGISQPEEFRGELTVARLTRVVRRTLARRCLSCDCFRPPTLHTSRFVEVWTLKARRGLPRLTPQCVAHTLWAMPRLRRGGGGEEHGEPLRPDVELLEGLLLRCSQVRRRQDLPPKPYDPPETCLRSLALWRH